MKNNNKILVVDIETTNFFDKGGLIVEIGIVELNLENGETNIIYNKLVKENGFGENHSDSWIFLNSDLKFIDVLSAENLDIETLQKLFNKYPATAYNKKFDFDFLMDRGLEINELPCPMVVATDVCKLPGYYGKYKWPSVQEAWDFLFGKTDYIEEHRGADDALHEAQIVYELYKQGKFNIPNCRSCTESPN